ncbi:MAG: NGG1p interacting factor NIF3 [Chloroflexi bacterium]|nr:NGG1p interacting factor NIF3 [Chloroflexota bacterium]
MTMTIQQVIDAITAAIPDKPGSDTVDTVKTGDPSRPLTGVVTTFLATCQVVRRAIELGANLIITHEPTFYNHRDEVDWLGGDPVYEAKLKLLNDHGIVVWRFHDYWHRHVPDGIITGVLRQLGWEKYADAEQPALCAIPARSVVELAGDLKAGLDVASVRVIGHPNTLCRRVGLAVGAGGGRWQIRALREGRLDALVVGELHEWETAEYVRDAVALGQRVALIVIGHANSEEPGMAYLVDWLAKRLPGVPVTHVPAGDPFWYA